MVFWKYIQMRQTSFSAVLKKWLRSLCTYPGRKSDNHCSTYTHMKKSRLWQGCYKVVKVVVRWWQPCTGYWQGCEKSVTSRQPSDNLVVNWWVVSSRHCDDNLSTGHYDEAERTHAGYILEQISFSLRHSYQPDYMMLFNSYKATQTKFTVKRHRPHTILKILQNFHYSSFGTWSCIIQLKVSWSLRVASDKKPR